MIGRAVLRATGSRVQQHITSRLLQPLGMVDTTWVRPEHEHWARPHRWRDGELVRDWPTPIGDGEIAPMGGLEHRRRPRQVDRLADSANSLPHQPASNGLSAASRREMQRAHTYIGVTTVAGRSCPAGYGFGLNVRDEPSLRTVLAHAGGLPGYGSNMRSLAGRGVGAIALGNTTYADGRATMRMLDVARPGHAPHRCRRPHCALPPTDWWPCSTSGATAMPQRCSTTTSISTTRWSGDVRKLAG
jgi:CubicO group peptidase (beta-lactamase class C family)